MSPWVWVVIATGFLVACVAGLVGLQKLKEIEEARELRTRYLTIFRNQPDLLATLDGREGLMEIHGHYSRFGPKRLIGLPVPTGGQKPGSDGPTTQALVIFDTGPTVTVVFHELKAYAVTQKSAIDAKDNLEDPFLAVAGFLAEKNVTVVEIGMMSVGDYDAQLIEISDGKSDPIRAFICPSLENAIVKLEIPFEHSKNKVSSRYELSGVTLSIDEELFRVPRGFADVSHLYKTKLPGSR